jgi:hypothetical protein
MNSLAFDFPESEEFGDTESEPGKVDGGASGDGGSSVDVLKDLHGDWINAMRGGVK